MNTLIKLRNHGLAIGTLRNTSFSLRHVAKHADLGDPESVKRFIAEKRCANSYKNNLAKSYNYDARVNGIEWVKPNFRYESELPKIPTTEQVNKLIDSASRKYSTIFRLIAETGVMPIKLSRVHRRYRPQQPHSSSARSRAHARAHRSHFKP